MTARDCAFRDGDCLVTLRKNARLPSRCIKTNRPTDLSIDRTLCWHSPSFYLLFVRFLPFYLMLYPFIRKTALIKVPITEEVLRTRKASLCIAWLVGLGSPLLSILAYRNLDRETLRHGSVLLLALLLVVPMLSAGFGLISTRVIRARKMDEQFVWIEGVCDDYLDQLPPWNTDAEEAFSPIDR